MSEATHTAGPWKWHWRSENGEANGSVYAEPREGHAYAVAICPRYQTKEQWEVDAPLLAASLDMLAALKIARGYVAKMLETVKHVDDRALDGARSDFARIEKAIAKAEGRVP